MHFCDWPYLTESSAFLQLHPTSKSARILSDASFCYVAGCFTFLTIFFFFFCLKMVCPNQPYYLFFPDVFALISWSTQRCMNYIKGHSWNRTLFEQCDLLIKGANSLSQNSGWLHEENDMHVSTNDMEYRRVCYFITVDDYLTTHSNKGGKKCPLWTSLHLWWVCLVDECCPMFLFFLFSCFGAGGRSLTQILISGNSW